MGMRLVPPLRRKGWLRLPTWLLRREEGVPRAEGVVLPIVERDHVRALLSQRARALGQYCRERADSMMRVRVVAATRVPLRELFSTTEAATVLMPA
jgi:hypothetical protein